MKTNSRYTVRSSKIHSLKDLEVEKQRLRVEIVRKEQDIQSGYRNILHALSPRNLASSMVNEISTTSNVVSKAISIGKAIMARRKKKKHDEKLAQNAEPQP